MVLPVNFEVRIGWGDAPQKARRWRDYTNQPAIIFQVPEERLPHGAAEAVGQPLTIGPMALSDGTTVPGFLACGSDLGPDSTRFGGWRQDLRPTGKVPV